MRDLSNCVVEKFNEYNIIRVEFNKKLRQTFCPIDIIYKPVKRPDEIINCYFGEKLNLALCASFNGGTKIKHCSAWQCYFCSNYCTRKDMTVISKFVQVDQVMSIILIHKIY